MSIIVLISTFDDFEKYNRSVVGQQKSTVFWVNVWYSPSYLVFLKNELIFSFRMISVIQRKNIRIKNLTYVIYEGQGLSHFLATKR